MRMLPVLLALAAAATVTVARAETVYGISTAATPSLLFFDSAAPAAFTTVGAISGVVAGESLRGIDFRPADGLLYAISTTAAGGTAHIYTINLATGAATTVGGAITLTGNTSTRVSIDFNPVVDRLRVVTGSGQNYRINPITGALAAQDTDISGTPTVAAIAYTNNFVGATQTTLYAYDFLTDQLGTIGGINGVPSPNGGVLSFIGASGVITGTAGCGMDISGASGIAYFSCDDFSSPGTNAEFFTVNLGTGFLTRVGPFDFAPVLDISVLPVTAVPEPETWALMLAGLAAAAAVSRRRRERQS